MIILLTLSMSKSCDFISVKFVFGKTLRVKMAKSESCSDSSQLNLLSEKQEKSRYFCLVQFVFM